MVKKDDNTINYENGQNELTVFGNEKETKTNHSYPESARIYSEKKSVV